MKKKIIILACLITLSITGVTAATIINSKDVNFDNTTSKLSSTNVQDAIDELYKNSKLKNRKNIVEAYTYNQTTGAENYCVTGDEDTCIETACYESTTAGSCPAGTIIIYKLNENETGRFHVMYDNGTTMTMQSQRNTVYNIPWIDKADYAMENTDGTTCNYTSCNDEGPITILNALESATAGWTNVNNQTYTMGTTVFKTNAYTGCTAYNTCATNTYTLPSRTSKARMITLQEAVKIGCTSTERTCPIWMYNYMTTSTNNGGTANDTAFGPNGTDNYLYLTMTAYSTYSNHAWFVTDYGAVYNNFYVYRPYFGARAVVEINK